MNQTNVTAKMANAAMQVCTNLFRRLPREIARHSAERRLLIRTAASVEKRSIEDVERDLIADEDESYDRCLQHLLITHPAMAVMLDDREVVKGKPSDEPGIA